MDEKRDKWCSTDRMLVKESEFPMFYLPNDIFLMSFISIMNMPDSDKCCMVYSRGTVPSSKKQFTFSSCTHIISAVGYLELHTRIPKWRSQKNTRKHDHSAYCCHVLAGKKQPGGGPLASIIFLRLELHAIPVEGSKIDSYNHCWEGVVIAITADKILDSMQTSDLRVRISTFFDLHLGF